MSPGIFLKAFLLQNTLFSTWGTWGMTAPLASATVDQCQLDCAAESTTSDSISGTATMWDTQRLVGPTEPATELNATYPHAKAPFPLPFHIFCQLGCSYFFTDSPQNTTCKGRCDNFYARNVSVGISDYAEKVRLRAGAAAGAFTIRDGCKT